MGNAEICMLKKNDILLVLLRLNCFPLVLLVKSCWSLTTTWCHLLCLSWRFCTKAKGTLTRPLRPWKLQGEWRWQLLWGGCGVRNVRTMIAAVTVHAHLKVKTWTKGSYNATFVNLCFVYAHFAFAAVVLFSIFWVPGPVTIYRGGGCGLLSDRYLV